MLSFSKHHYIFKFLLIFFICRTLMNWKITVFRGKIHGCLMMHKTVIGKKVGR